MKRASIKKVGSPGFINDGIYIILSILLLISMSGLSEHNAYAQNSTIGTLSKVNVEDGDEWYYFKGLQNPPHNWNSPDLNVGNWLSGPTGIGYGMGTSRTHLEDMQGNYSTIYARKEFLINNPATTAGMTLSVVCDGPFIAYLNGVEMIRTKTVQASTPDQPIRVSDVEQFNVSGFMHELNSGKNVLAIQCDNDDINSEDYSFIPVFAVFEKGGDNNVSK